MKKNGKKLLILGTALLVMFVIWTCLIQCVDVQSAGQKGTEIGFATFNCWFHRVTGLHMAIYTITDWLGLVPIFVCMTLRRKKINPICRIYAVFWSGLLTCFIFCWLCCLCIQNQWKNILHPWTCSAIQRHQRLTGWFIRYCFFY